MPDAKRPKTIKRRAPTRPTPKPKEVKPPKGGPKIGEEHVVLVARPGREDKGGGQGGEYWDVEVDGKRAGEVFVNMIDEPPLGRHASLQIFLNLPDQGKGVGRIAYRKAAEVSQHTTLYLHMRKANVASRLAAEAAGFQDASSAGITQLIYKRVAGAE